MTPDQLYIHHRSQCSACWLVDQVKVRRFARVRCETGKMLVRATSLQARVLVEEDRAADIAYRKAHDYCADCDEPIVKKAVHCGRCRLEWNICRDLEVNPVRLPPGPMTIRCWQCGGFFPEASHPLFPPARGTVTIPGWKRRVRVPSCFSTGTKDTSPACSACLINEKCDPLL